MTHPLSGLVFQRLVTPEYPRPAAPTLQEAEAARNSWDVGVVQQLPGQSAGSDSSPDVPIPDVPRPDVPLPDVPLHDIPPLDVRPDVKVGEKQTSTRVAEEAYIVVTVGF